MIGVGKKRQRVVIVCNNCHRKKVKCDKRQPCSRCIKLGIDSSCSYSLTTSRSYVDNKDTNIPPYSEDQMPPSVHAENTTSGDISSTNEKMSFLSNKIHELENLVKSTCNSPLKSVNTCNNIILNDSFTFHLESHSLEASGDEVLTS